MTSHSSDSFSPFVAFSAVFIIIIIIEYIWRCARERCSVFVCKRKRNWVCLFVAAVPMLVVVAVVNFLVCSHVFLVFTFFFWIVMKSKSIYDYGYGIDIEISLGYLLFAFCYLLFCVCFFCFILFFSVCLCIYHYVRVEWVCINLFLLCNFFVFFSIFIQTMFISISLVWFSINENEMKEKKAVAWSLADIAQELWK